MTMWILGLLSDEGLTRRTLLQNLRSEARASHDSSHSEKFEMKNFAQLVYWYKSAA
jgi:hypothetical protein